MDRITPAQRSANMAKIRSRDTKPEMLVRSLLHGLGYRFRLHRRDLPGCPDLVFPARMKAIQVHGCFWHGHRCRLGGTGTKSNSEFWNAKIIRNRNRDIRTAATLRKAGWELLIVWECETKNPALAKRLRAFLGRPGVNPRPRTTLAPQTYA